jgi:hypothetical protein
MLKPMLPLLLLVAAPALAGPQVGTLTALEGEVKLFSHPSAKDLKGPGPHAKFEGLFYSVRDAKVGDKVDRGNWIRTQPGARARVIFENGDQFMVGPASNYRIDWDRDTDKGKPELELRYGKARFVIARKGPRHRITVRTRAAVMGVRGTDFFVAVNDATGTTETAALRGSVAVEPSAGAAKAAVVDAGETASVATPPAPAAEGAAAAAPSEAPAAIEVRRTSQTELQAIQRNSVVKPSTPPPAEVAESVKALEKAAAETTLADIRQVDPSLASKLEAAAGEGPLDAEALNQATVDKVAEDAPKEAGKAGPISDEALERGKQLASVTPEATSEKAADTPGEEAPPSLPRLWIGPRFATGDRGVRHESGNDGVNSWGSISGETRSPGKSTAGLGVEWELGRNLSLFGEFFPAVKRGSEFYVNASPSANYDGEISINGTDVVLGFRPGIPFGRKRVFALHGIVAFRQIFVTDAMYFTHGGSSQGPTTGSTEIDDKLNKSLRNLEVGFGLSLRPFRRVKLTAEFRKGQGIGATGNTSSHPFPTPADAALQGPMSENFITLGLSYGMLTD